MNKVLNRFLVIGFLGGWQKYIVDATLYFLADPPADHERRIA
jgi:hypothetical protein